MAYPVPTNRPTKWYERKSLRQIFIYYAEKSRYDEIASNSPGGVAGLKNGDEIIAMNGEKIFSPDSRGFCAMEMSNSPVKPLTLTVPRRRAI